MASEAVEAESVEASDWPLRPWLLAGLLGVAALLIHLITGGRDNVPWQMAAAAFLLFGSLGAAFTIDEDRWKGPLCSRWRPAWSWPGSPGARCVTAKTCPTSNMAWPPA